MLLAGEMRGTVRCCEEQLFLGLRERPERARRRPAAVREVHRGELRLLRGSVRRAWPAAASAAECESDTRDLQQQYWGLHRHGHEQVTRSSRRSDNLQGQLDFRLLLCAMFAWPSIPSI
eukprot:SAG11_NODE_82_length_17639_cov_6.427594_8_plen_119_part_00